MNDGTGYVGFRRFEVYVTAIWVGDTAFLDKQFDILPNELRYSVTGRLPGFKDTLDKIAPTNRVSHTVRLNSATLGAPATLILRPDRSPELYGLVEEISFKPCGPDTTLFRAPRTLIPARVAADQFTTE